MFLSSDPIREEETLMSELQGPRIPGEEGSRRSRPLGWIIGGLIALLLLALLIPFACQALGGGSDPQSGGSGAQERAEAQGADTAQGGAEGGDDASAAAGENARAESKGAGASRDGEEAAVETDRGEETSGGRAGARTGGDLPETGGMSPAVLPPLGGVALVMAAGLSTLVRRRIAGRV
jgi:LPXTG-motif cell wall-anchored protein